MFSFDSSLDSVKPTFAFSKVCCVDGSYLLLLLSGPLRLPLVLNFPGEVQNWMCVFLLEYSKEWNCSDNSLRSCCQK